MESLRGDRTIQAIEAKHEIHPNQVSSWKRQAQAGLEELFAGASKCCIPGRFADGFPDYF